MKNSPLKDFGLAFFRVSISIMLLTHGLPKLQKLFAGDFEFGDPLGIGAAPSLFLAVLGEFLCPILVLIGYKTRYVSIPVIITMFVAAFLVHANDPFGSKEKALLYLVSFIAIALLGGGKFSVDKK